MNDESQAMALSVNEKVRKHLSDTLLLLLSNLVVIVLALVQGWNIVPLLWIFWSQNIIIGILNWKRMTLLKTFSSEGLKINNKRVKPIKKTQKSVTIFFLVHYFGFHLAYLIFIISSAGTISNLSFLSMIVGLTMFGMHHYSSYRKKVERDHITPPNIGTLAFLPYARIVPMHLIIIIGIQFEGGSRLLLLIFLLLKTLADLTMHLIQGVNWKLLGQQNPDLMIKIKKWVLLTWFGFLLLVVFGITVIKEFWNR